MKAGAPVNAMIEVVAEYTWINDNQHQGKPGA